MCWTLSYHKRKSQTDCFTFFGLLCKSIYVCKISPKKFMLVKFLKTGHPQNFKCLQKMLKIFPNVVGNCSSYNKILEIQVLQRGTRQTNHNNVFIFNFYISILNCLNTTCPPSHHHNGCMAICVLGYTYVRLHLAGIQNIFCRTL